MGSTFVTDSYPFHLDSNYTATLQFTCPKLLQRKHTHARTHTKAPARCTFSRARARRPRAGSSPPRSSLASACHSRGFFLSVHGCSDTCSPRGLNAAFNAWSCTLINPLSRVCVCACVFACTLLKCAHLLNAITRPVTHPMSGVHRVRLKEKGHRVTRLTACLRACLCVCVRAEV